METLSWLTMRGPAVLLAALLAAGCSAEEKKAPPVPPGSREYRADVYAFAYPASWSPRDDKEASGAPALKVDGPELPSGLPDGQIEVGRRDRTATDLGDQLAQFRGLALLNGYRVTGVRTVRLDGAADARRVEATYTITGKGGAKIPMRLVGLYALTKRRTLLAFMVHSPAQGTAAAKVPGIIASFHLTGKR
ncbi:hypothetical protein [Actinomadura roseirufa]|uniref:hypothetical protein n=1 Tax=Actinomadura roseirufa TaxID=2094049 RepID=UPI001041A892|nr:hypothetical protein [Actinomadura roseirufa]